MIGMEKNLVGSRTSLQRHVARGTVAVVIVSLNVKYVDPRPGINVDDGDAAVGRDVLIARAAKMDSENSICRGSVWIRGEDIDLIFEMRDQRPTLGNGHNEQRRLANGDRLSPGFRVRSRVLDCCLNENSRCTLTKRSAREIVRKFEIEVIDAVVVGLAGSGGRFEESNVDARSFDGNVGMIDGFPEEVIGANSTGNVLSRTIVAFRLVIFFREFDGYLELRENVTLNI